MQQKNIMLLVLKNVDASNIFSNIFIDITNFEKQMPRATSLFTVKPIAPFVSISGAILWPSSPTLIWST